MQIPTFNVGMIGHVAHGKTTLVRALTGEKTQRSSTELERNITINLGYSNCKIWQCTECNGWQSTNSSPTSQICKVCFGACKLVKHFSFVDCPGHQSFMATMIGGAAVMNYAILLVAANQDCPQPQTADHLKAARAAGIPVLFVVQNKIDVCTPEQVMKNYKQIQAFVPGLKVFPVVAQKGWNTDLLLEQIAALPEAPHLSTTPLFHVVRSFDVNRPGTEVEGLRGGVLGISIVKGAISIGDEIELHPSGRRTRVVRITTGSASLEVSKAGVGGLFGIETLLDPAVTRADAAKGQVSGLRTDLVTSTEIILRWYRFDESSTDKLRKADKVDVIVGLQNVPGSVVGVKGERMKIQLSSPVSYDTFWNFVILKDKRICCYGKAEH